MSVHPLDGALQRVERAEEHLRELKRQIELFRQDYLEGAIVHFDSKPPYDVHVLHPPGQIEFPPLLSILVGECIYNLRASLDYLVFELALSDSGMVQQNTQFPIDDTPKKFARSVECRLVGVSPAHVATIEGLQPCNGCNWTKVLRTISNPDKHRKLTPKGGSFGIEVIADGFYPSIHVNVRTKKKAKRPDGLEVEVEFVGALFITIPVGKHDGMPIGDVVEETLERLIAETRDTIKAFKPEFG